MKKDYAESANYFDYEVYLAGEEYSDFLDRFLPGYVRDFERWRKECDERVSAHIRGLDGRK